MNVVVIVVNVVVIVVNVVVNDNAVVETVEALVSLFMFPLLYCCFHCVAVVVSDNSKKSKQ